jgi:hypothetical protein
MQFATTGVRLQTRIGGSEKKISGVANLSAGRVFGGRSFYRAATGDSTKRSPFGTASFSMGLVLEEKVQLTWSKIFFGPRTLQQGGSFFTVNVTR